MASASTYHLANYTAEQEDCTVKSFNRAIQQGRDTKITILYPGDQTTGIPNAEIRDRTIEQGGTILATFSYDPLTYDGVTDKTTITLTLSATETELIPETPEIKSDRLQSADKYDQWDAYLAIGGENLRMVEQGFVQVLGRSTA